MLVTGDSKYHNMANSQRIVIFFLISLLLTISIYTLMFSETADAQVSSNTLESIVNQTRSSGESAQIDMDGIPQYILVIFSQIPFS